MEILIKQVRLEKTMSIRELSRRSKVSIAHIHDVENGKKEPTINVLCKIAQALEVKPEALFKCE